MCIIYRCSYILGYRYMASCLMHMGGGTHVFVALSVFQGASPLSFLLSTSPLFFSTSNPQQPIGFSTKFERDPR